VESIGGSKYYFTITDDSTRLCVSLYLKEKGGAYEAIRQYLEVVKQKHGKYPTYICFDNGKKFVNNKLKDWARSKGITI
jgi:hypothetical protein